MPASNSDGGPGFTLASVSFPLFIVGVAAGACVIGAAVLLVRSGDGFGSLGLLLNGVWVGCLGWLYRARRLGKRSATTSLVASPPAHSTASDDDRPDAAGTDGDSEAGPSAVPGSNRGSRALSRRERRVAAVMIAAMLAQVVVFHYSPTIRL